LDYHRLSFTDFYKKINIDENIAKNGLSNAEASKRNQEQGDNALTEKKKDPWYVQLFHEMTSFFSLLLWAGSILCFISYGLDKSDPSNLYLGIVLAVVVFITGLVTFF
jgi:sodium/potassium-transporting ATPase subunit alpha